MQQSTKNDTSSLYLPQNFCVNICQCILEEALHQLFILQRISNDPKISVVKPFSNSATVKKKIGSSGNQFAENVNLATFKKNFTFIEETLRTVYEELRTNGTFEKLTEIVKTLNTKKLEEINIKKETVRMQVELEKLQYTLYEEEKCYHRKIAKCMADIGKIKDEIEDFLVESEIKTDYIEKWQNSKIEMNEIALEGMEQSKMNTLKKLDADTYKETRVHQEIIAAYNEMQQDIKIEKNKWEEKFKTDYKELEAKIQTIKDKRGKQNEATRILKQTYLKREREINDYKMYKIQQEEKKLVLKKRNEAATKIQAWWRGTMVRKGFGKFRKKKDKKGKKKGPEKPEKK